MDIPRFKVEVFVADTSSVEGGAWHTVAVTSNEHVKRYIVAKAKEEEYPFRVTNQNLNKIVEETEA